MNPAVAAALLSRTTPAKKLEPSPKPVVGPDLVAAAGGPEALQELVLLGNDRLGWARGI